MIDLAEIAHAAQLLRKGQVVAFPTETVYGLGADARNPEAIDLVFTLKGRPRNNPLIVHVSGPDMARTVAASWPPAAERLAAELWPGPLSILVPRRHDLPEAVTAGGDLVAVRCPNHPLALALLFAFQGPLVGPSANLSGQISPTTASHVRETFSDREAFVLDGGPCAAGIESTVIDITSSPPRILRPGLVGARQISELLGVEVREPDAGQRLARSDPAESLVSPGLLERHYAPRTPAKLFSGDEWKSLAAGRRAALLTLTAPSIAPPHHAAAMPREPGAYAAALYAALRAADAQNADIILIERPPASGDPIWIAVADRLRRAASP
ncbi:MAG: threonylcarbamoyl-AMP synthase [Phycisphaerales bacterium]|nr:threonylcarbamoyl-AMP synthase [Phycisphaerales bacterium]